MKSLIVLIAAVLLTSSSFSQALKPTVLLQGNDTLVCFTPTQGKYVAKKIVHAEYCDSIVGSLNKQKDDLIESRRHHQEIGRTLREEVNNLNIMLTNDSTIIETKDIQIKAEQQEVKRQKRQKLLAIVISIITGVAAIVT